MNPNMLMSLCSTWLLLVACGARPDPEPVTPEPVIEPVTDPEPDPPAPKDPDTTHLDMCKEECIIGQEQCFYEAEDAVVQCEISCDQYDQESSYDKCLGTCRYKLELAEKACSGHIDKCEQACEINCSDYGCKD